MVRVTRARANSTVEVDSARRERPSSGSVRATTKTTAPEALDLAEEVAPGAPEVDMLQELVARGKASGHAARARRRAERAIADGRTPGKPGGVPKVCGTCGTRHKFGPCPPEAIEARARAIAGAS